MPSLHSIENSYYSAVPDQRTTAILHEAELSPPHPITALAKRDFGPLGSCRSNQSHVNEAQALLVQLRTSEPGYRPPDAQVRHVFRTKKSKERKCDPSNWVFTKHEVARTFNELLSREALPAPGIAKALLSHASGSSLEELWNHLHDSKLEKRTRSRFKQVRSSASEFDLTASAILSSKALSSPNESLEPLVPTPSTASQITWLDGVCCQNNVEYISLMCQHRLGQDVLSRGLKSTLSNCFLEATAILLSYGAVVPAVCVDTIRERVKLHDVDLVRLLLSAPYVMGSTAWQTCLEPEFQSLKAGSMKTPEILLLCVGQCQDLISKDLLLEALESQNLMATAIALAYGRFDGSGGSGNSERFDYLGGFKGFGRFSRSRLFAASGRMGRQNSLHYRACEYASCIQDDGLRYKFFKMLADSKFLADSTILRQELVKNVKACRLPLIRLLADADVIVDLEPHNAFCCAVSGMHFDILKLFTKSNFSSDISLAMTYVPKSPSESSLIQLVEILAPLGLVGEPLDSYLPCAVQSRHVKLVDLLISHGASIEFENASAVQVALKCADLEILDILLRNRCSAPVLSTAIPSAMALESRPVRLGAMKALVQKGIPSQELGIPLQGLVSEDGETDFELIQLLLQHGAPVDRVGDQANSPFLIATKKGDLSLLEMLCEAKPRQETLSVAVVVAFGLADASIALTHKSFEIVSCLLRHGLDVNFEHGQIFLLAIREKHSVLLQRLLSVGPSIASLRAAFDATIGAQPRDFELHALGLLLVNAESVEIGQSKWLERELMFASSGDFAGLRLLLRHKAVPNLSTFNDAFLITANSSLSWDQKEEVYDSLSINSFRSSTEDMSNLLARSVTSFPECTQLTQKVLSCGARPTSGILKAALENSSLEVVIVLLRSVESFDARLEVFTHARQITMALDRRYAIYQQLLKEDIPGDDVSEALLDSLKNEELSDLSLLKLLLENGASPTHQDGKPFSLVLRANSPNSFPALELLCQYLVGDNVATIAFDVVRGTPRLKRRVRMTLYRRLLEWNVDKSSLSKALTDSFEGELPHISDLRLLLKKGADPNTNAGCLFAMAAKRGALAEFQALCKYTHQGKVLRVLLDNFTEEQEVLQWFKVCLQEKSRSGKIESSESVFLCMKKFPAGKMLLKFLFDHGVPASAKIDHRLCASWKPEQCTALIWALFQQPRIENDVILLLLSQGDAALPAYSTPVTKVSAAFACLLDKTRFPILKALLELDGDLVTDYVVPGSSLGELAMSPKVFKKDADLLDNTEEIPLREAALYLGNFEAFRLISAEQTPNDGLLHLASLLALPKFVKWLLKFHDPDHKAEEFDNMIPLACVCASKPHHWCKIANEESDWETRQKQTMRLLAGVTSPKWRYRNMTILHWAMENGVETIKAMVEALDIYHDLERDGKYLYKDRDGIEHSPQQYVIRIWDGNAKDKEALAACFEAVGLQ